jgi:hypothetical protein
MRIPLRSESGGILAGAVTAAESGPVIFFFFRESGGALPIDWGDAAAQNGKSSAVENRTSPMRDRR